MPLATSLLYVNTNKDVLSENIKLTKEIIPVINKTIADMFYKSDWLDTISRTNAILKVFFSQKRLGSRFDRTITNNNSNFKIILLF